MDKEELIIRHNLVSSEQYQEIRKRVLDKIVEYSSSKSDLIHGALWLIKLIDTWEDDYQKELLKRKEN